MNFTYSKQIIKHPAPGRNQPQHQGSRNFPTSWLVSGMGFQASQMKVERNSSLLETGSGYQKRPPWNIDSGSVRKEEIWPCSELAVLDSGKRTIHFSSNLVKVYPSQRNAMQWPGITVKIQAGVCVKLAVTNLEGNEPRETNEDKSLLLSWQRSCGCHVIQIRPHSSACVRGV